MTPAAFNPSSSNFTIYQSYYGSLPPCPNQPSNCPTINGGGNESTCPKYCSVTRSPKSFTGSSIITTGGKQFINPRTQIKEAVCPSGYAAINTYNMDLETAYTSAPIVITPISSRANMNQFTASGLYTCGPTSLGVPNPELFYNANNCHVEHNAGDYVDPSDPYSFDSQHIVYIQRVVDGSTCTCKGSCAPCSCAVVSDRAHSYYYKQIICTSYPGGVYLTGNRVPVSLVCARTTMSWVPVPTR